VGAIVASKVGANPIISNQEISQILNYDWFWLNK
jgi:hypothetical protein